MTHPPALPVKVIKQTRKTFIPHLEILFSGSRWRSYYPNLITLFTDEELVLQIQSMV